jgi:hypothetical protein
MSIVSLLESATAAAPEEEMNCLRFICATSRIADLGLGMTEAHRPLRTGK